MSNKSDIVEDEANEEQENEHTFETLYKSMLTEVADVHNKVRTIKENVKSLEKLHKHEIKMSYKMKRHAKLNKEPQKPSGFNKSTRVPQTIINLLNLEEDIELPRTKVTKLIYGYINILAVLKLLQELF